MIIEFMNTIKFPHTTTKAETSLVTLIMDWLSDKEI
ncbi:hypothetical protein MHYMCMPSP_01222 [Hyalomma marginatum]|uniref:Uncharacterized protein n=1 Tax=Hyalomma marginatum TaxID=34627 RepID=A0A8S4C2G7_9ACAR|nr:hypothetical protein MHYMCMPASI_00656 [Hyalomma marginatum]CAG7599643.1 hypothetical protein MHYMCMPSP_01222 [Hyalomma marginatum]